MTRSAGAWRAPFGFDGAEDPMDACPFPVARSRRRVQSRRGAGGQGCRPSSVPSGPSRGCCAATSAAGRGRPRPSRGGERSRCATAVESGTCDHTGSAGLDRIRGAILDGLGTTLSDFADLRADRDEPARSGNGPSRDIPAVKRKLGRPEADHGRMVNVVLRGVVEGHDREDATRVRGQRSRGGSRERRQSRVSTRCPHPARPLDRRAGEAAARSRSDPRPGRDEGTAWPGRPYPAPKTEDDPDEIGDLPALIAPTERMGVGVAEEGLEPPTRGL